MANSCYRCGAQVPEQTPFCPACSAPQIRVTQSPVTDSEVSGPSGSTQAAAPILNSSSSSYAAAIGSIQWRKFLRIAWPLAAITGVVMGFRPALGFVVLLPVSIAWAVSRYRRIHMGQMSAAVGARLGAAVGLLSFSLVLVMLLADLVANSKDFQREMVAKIGEFAASNPDPQAQPFLQWAATSTGIVVFTALGMALFMVIFVGFASFTGAMVAHFSRNKE